MVTDKNVWHVGILWHGCIGWELAFKKFYLFKLYGFHGIKLNRIG